ncbi:hypothetical protein ACIBG7_12700 [Nonomuraea sp. NPDC050328]|uniref:hypothetical protein n=1 Tax=Nonomuraea sp. NPDC050328 TaxID=3364361 RepID=UPI00378ED705
MFVYRNSSTGQVVELPDRDVRLDHLDVWLLIAEPAPEDLPEQDPEPAPEPRPERPSENDTKATWVAYAVARGMAEGDAKSLSKAALVEEFGRDDEEDD